MLYKSDSEFIVYTRDDQGLYQSKIVHKSVKSDLYGELNGRLKNYKTNVQPLLTYKTETQNGMLAVMTRGPVLLNILAGRGYKNVLFVGHYNQGETMNWMLDAASDRILDDIHYESRNVSAVMDFNVSYQFLPILAKVYGYGFDVTIAKPPESKHNGAMHYLYEKWDIPTIETNKQYKHGSESTTLLTQPEEPIDAIVFLGVPKKYDDTTFTSQQIKSIWGGALKAGGELVDIYYSEADKLRFSDRESIKDINPQIVKAFSNRAEWDQEVVTGRPTHFQAIERCVTVV